jgi:hypothetical protein
MNAYTVVRGALVGPRLVRRAAGPGHHAIAMVREEKPGCRVFNALFLNFTRPERVMRRPAGAPIDLFGLILYLPRRNPWWLLVREILNPDGAGVIPFRRPKAEGER